MTTFIFSTYLAGATPSTNIIDYDYFKNLKILTWFQNSYNINLSTTELANYNSSEIKFCIPSILQARTLLNQIIERNASNSAFPQEYFTSSDALDFYCMGVIKNNNESIEFFDVISNSKVFGVNSIGLASTLLGPQNAQATITYLNAVSEYSVNSNYNSKFGKLADNTVLTTNIPPSKLLNAKEIRLMVFPKFYLKMLRQQNNNGGEETNIKQFNINWDSRFNAYFSQEPITDNINEILYSFDTYQLKSAVDAQTQYLYNIANDPNASASKKDYARRCLEYTTGPNAYNFCALALTIENMNSFSGIFGTSTHQSSGVVNSAQNLSFTRDILEKFAQQVQNGTQQPMRANDGTNIIRVVYERNLNQNSVACIFVFSYALTLMQTISENNTEDNNQNNTTRDYAPYIIQSTPIDQMVLWSVLDINPEYWRYAQQMTSTIGQTSVAFVVTNILAAKFRPEVLNFNLVADQAFQHGQYRFEFYSYWDQTFPDMYKKSEEQWNQLLTMPLGQLDGFGNIDITIPSDYGNWVIMKVISYNSGPVERLDRLTITAKEIQNKIPEMLSGYNITDIDFESNWYGFALDSGSNTTGITNRMTYCKVFRINNTNNISTAGWVRVTSPDSNAWIYKFNKDGFDFGDLDRDGDRKNLLLTEQELQKPVYIMVTTPNEYQTGWFNILTGREDFAGDRRYQIFDSSFNDLITLNEGSPDGAFNRYNDSIIEENKWCDISAIQHVKRDITYNKELIDDPRGNGKIWKISPIMNPGSYYVLESAMLGSTFYANSPEELRNSWACFQGAWNGNYITINKNTIRNFTASIGVMQNDYDEIKTYNDEKIVNGLGITTRKYIGETTDNWGNSIPNYKINFYSFHSAAQPNLSNWNIVGLSEIYFNKVPNQFLQNLGWLGTYETITEIMYRDHNYYPVIKDQSDWKQLFADPLVNSVIRSRGRTYDPETFGQHDTYVVDYIKEVKLGEDYTGTFYIKPLEYL